MSTTAIGIDLGTTRIKASLVSIDREELHFAAAPTPWRRVDGQLQLDMAELGDEALRMAGEVAEWGLARGHEVAGIACTGMAETGALLGPDGTVLAPGFAWHHTLGDAGRVQSALGLREFTVTAGRSCTLAPSIIKLDHLRASGHRFEPGQTWLNVPDYVAWRLCGVRAAEVSTSSRTGLVDIVNRRWWAEALEFLGVGPWFVPDELLPAGTRLGVAGGEVPEALRGITVSTGGHDHPMAALSLGGYEFGTLDMSMGTAEAQLRIVTPDLTPDQIAALVDAGASIDWHPLGDRFTVLSALPTGMTMERLAALLGATDRESRRRLSAEALEAEPSELRLVDVALDDFGIAGISDGVTRAGLWRAAAEQLVRASKQGTDRISAILGEPARVFIFGGWIKDALVARLRAPLGQVPAEHEPEEPGALGAGLMALAGAGTMTFPEAGLASPGTGETGIHTGGKDKDV